MTGLSPSSRKVTAKLSPTMTTSSPSWLKPFADYFAKRRISLEPYFDKAQIEEAVLAVVNPR